MNDRTKFQRDPNKSTICIDLPKQTKLRWIRLANKNHMKLHTFLMRAVEQGIREMDLHGQDWPVQFVRFVIKGYFEDRIED